LCAATAIWAAGRIAPVSFLALGRRAQWQLMSRRQGDHGVEPGRVQAAGAYRRAGMVAYFRDRYCVFAPDAVRLLGRAAFPLAHRRKDRPTGATGPAFITRTGAARLGA
jgi:hypothetical protein